MITAYEDSVCPEAVIDGVLDATVIASFRTYPMGSDMASSAALQITLMCT